MAAAPQSSDHSFNTHMLMMQRAILHTASFASKKARKPIIAAACVITNEALWVIEKGRIPEELRYRV